MKQKWDGIGTPLIGGYKRKERMRGKGLVKKHRERNSEREGGRVRVKGEVK